MSFSFSSVYRAASMRSPFTKVLRSAMPCTWYLWHRKRVIP